jgi:hypothetical protein
MKEKTYMDAKDNVAVNNHSEKIDYSALSPRERLGIYSETVKTVLTKRKFDYKVTDLGMAILYRVPCITNKGYDSVFNISLMEDPGRCQMEIRIPTTLSVGRIFKLLDIINKYHNRTLGVLTYSYADKSLSYTFEIITRNGLNEDDLDTAADEMILWSRKIADGIKDWEEPSKEKSAFSSY